MMLWALVQQGSRQVMLFMFYLLIARILVPEDVGIMVMGLTWLALLTILQEMGFGGALIQSQGLSERHLGSVFALNVVAGGVLTLLGFVLSWAAAELFRTPSVQPVMAVLSLSILFNSLSLAHSALLQKRLQFRRLATRDISAGLVGCAIGVAAALLNFGVWSLVIQSVLTSLLSSVFTWRLEPWRPQMSLASVEALRDLWPYSWRLLAYGFFKFLVQNADKAIIGYVLGPVLLGIYWLGMRLIVMPINNLIGAVGNFAFAFFSKIQNDLQRVQRNYIFLLRVTLAVFTPVTILIIVLSPTGVLVVLGSLWAEHAFVFQVFALIGMTQALISPVGQLMKALGRPGWLLSWSIFFSIATCVGIWAGTGVGLKGVVIGLGLVHGLGVLVSIWIVIWLLNLNMGILYRALWPAAIGFLVFTPLLLGWYAGGLEGPIQLLIAVTLSQMVYVMLYTRMDPTLLPSLLTKIRERPLVSISKPIGIDEP